MLRLFVFVLLCPALFGCASEAPVSIAPEVQLTANAVVSPRSDVNGVRQPTSTPADSRPAPQTRATKTSVR